MYNKVTFEKREDFSFDPCFFLFCFVFCSMFTFMWEWLICSCHFTQIGDKWNWPFRQKYANSCILSVDGIMEGLHEVPHSFCYRLWRGFCNGVLFPLDKEVLWLVTFLMKALQREMQNVCSAVFSIWQLFLLSFFFFPYWSLAYFRKTYILGFFLILGLVDFHAFDPLKKLHIIDRFSRLLL